MAAQKNAIVKTETPTVDEAEAAKLAKEAKGKKALEVEQAALQMFQEKFVSGEAKGIAMLEAAKKAKKDDFTKQETDFWKPEKVGDTLQGVYMGSVPDRYTTHLLGTLDTKGNPLMMRIKGTKGLSGALGRVKAGTAVRIEFIGSEKTENGNFKKFDVGLLDVSNVEA